MNLAYFYPIIYWNCACLSVDSSAISSADFYNLVDDDIIVLDEDKTKKMNKMNYSNLASALDKFKKICSIHLPDINLSRLSFTPDVKSNSILYGLKGIMKVTAPVIEEIVMHRPYSSLEDFCSKVTKRIVTKDKIINLIKSGAFDNIEQKPRADILKEYIESYCDFKKRLTLQNANQLIEENLIPDDFIKEKQVYKLTKELRKHKDSSKNWYFGELIQSDENTIKIWRDLIVESNVKINSLTIDGGIHSAIEINKWDSFYAMKMDKIKNYIKTNQQEILDKLNHRIFMNERNKYCAGNETQWQLDSINFYFDEHPLKKIIPQIESRTDIVIDNLSDIVEGAQDGQFIIKGKIIPKMKLYTIVGTVIDRNKTKGIVTLQCPDGVVNVKVYKDLFSTFMQVIGTVQANGEKDIEQDSFFEKGVNLLITGVQRGAVFVPKVYKNLKRKAILKINLDSRNNFYCLEEKKEAEKDE